MTAQTPIQACSCSERPARPGDQYGQQAFAEVAEQGQDGEFFAGQAQHVGGAGIARATHSRIGVTGQAAEQNGEGQRAEQVGEGRQ